MASSWSVARLELFCPVCKDVYKDPVVLRCSHSVCHSCVKMWWRTKGSRPCPVCRVQCTSRTMTRNLVLKNLCEAFQLEQESGLICEEHGERLRIFCEEDRAPVCVDCTVSKQHRGHRFVPLDERARLRRGELQKGLDSLRAKAQLYRDATVDGENKIKRFRDQSRETEMKIRQEFRLLREFADREEADRITALRTEDGHKGGMMEEELAVLRSEKDALESTIETLEGVLKEENPALLSKADDLLREVQRPLPEDPKPVTAQLLDVGQYTENLRYNVWLKMMDMASFHPVTMNPLSAHPELHLSEDMTSVHCGAAQPHPPTPGRMEQHRCVLGNRGFSSGRVYWDVEVGDNQVWALGVLSENAWRSGDMQSGLWMLRFCKGKYTVFSPTCPGSVLPLRDKVQIVGILLDFATGVLSFTDPVTKTVIHTFLHWYDCVMFPYINTWSEQPLKILPLKVSVFLNG